MAPDSDLRRVFRTTLIINAALVGSLLLYALMAELIKSQLKPFPGFVSGLPLRTLRYLFFGAAVGAVGLVRLASRSLHKVTPGEDLHHMTLRLSRTTIMISALGELPAVLGFVLFLLIGFSRDFYVLLFVSLFLEFMYFPRLSVWQDLARERFPQQGI